MSPFAFGTGKGGKVEFIIVTVRIFQNIVSVIFDKASKGISPATSNHGSVIVHKGRLFYIGHGKVGVGRCALFNGYLIKPCSP